MPKKWTISSDVYERRRYRAALEAAYASMAADELREAEALEWIEGLIGDAADDPRHRSAAGP